MHIAFSPSPCITPQLIGQPLIAACQYATTYNLAIKLSGYKYDDDIPAGTIIHQIPTAGTPIKPHQSLHIIISQRPELPLAPNLAGKPLSTLQSDSSLTHYHLHSSYPTSSCFAQSPLPGTPVLHNNLIAYISSGDHTPIVWPDFTGYSVYEVQQFLHKHAITASYNHSHPVAPAHQCINCVIIDQIPRAGSILSCEKLQKIRIAFTVTR